MTRIPPFLCNDHEKIVTQYTILHITHYTCSLHTITAYRGQAVDDVDEMCKRLIQSRDCITIDNEIAGTTCDFAIEYTLPVGFADYNLTHDYTVLCEESNPVENFVDSEEAACARENCRVDSYYMREVTLFLQVGVLDMSFSGDSGFDGSSCRINTLIRKAPQGGLGDVKIDTFLHPKTGETP